MPQQTRAAVAAVAEDQVIQDHRLTVVQAS
jgi:hypothetical protein